MATTELGTLYTQLQQAFFAQPNDLQKCGVLLAKLKVLLAVSSVPSRPNVLRTRSASYPPDSSSHKGTQVSQTLPLPVSLAAHAFVQYLTRPLPRRNSRNRLVLEYTDKGHPLL